MQFWKILLLVGFACIHYSTQRATETNLANQKLSGIIQWKYEKRPFCNAFTGCGKKRNSLPFSLIKRSGSEMPESRALSDNNELTEELGDLIDINAEPAVENVQKQIMSQAKIFEAIKEASKEIFRQKNRQKLFQARNGQGNDEENMKENHK